MSRILKWAGALLCALMLGPGTAIAQDLGGLARVSPQESHVKDGWGGTVTLSLGLSQGVPWRVFQVDEPRRLVLDFREVDWSGLQAEVFDQSEGISAVRFGSFRDGWSRMVIDLASPSVIDTAELRVEPTDGSAILQVTLQASNAEEYAAQAGAPEDPRWDLPKPAVTQPTGQSKSEWAPMVVLLDPGHGGIDPGAEVDDLQEKDLMLTIARELRDTLRRAGGIDVVMTRDEDRFVSLEERVALAHRVQADVFISLHADALQSGHATGATVYTLSEEASDKASRLLAERHDRGEILAGLDLSDTDDVVANVLLDLARLETRPRTQKLARAMVLGMQQSTGLLNKKPLREAGFSVLKAADIPSILIEVGFMSSDRDLSNLKDPNWRATVNAGIRDGLLAWRQADQAAKGLVRQ